MEADRMRKRPIRLLRAESHRVGGPPLSRFGPRHPVGCESVRAWECASVRVWERVLVCACVCTKYRGAIVCAGRGRRAHSPSKVSVGGPDRKSGGQRDRQRQTERQAGRQEAGRQTRAAERSCAFPACSAVLSCAALCAVPRKSGAAGPTRLWSRVIGGAGCCPACRAVQASSPPVQP